MNSEWLRGVPRTQHAERTQLVNSSGLVLDALTTILKRKHDDLLKEAQSKATYDGPSWPFQQADYNAAMRTLREIIDLTEVTHE